MAAEPAYAAKPLFGDGNSPPRGGTLFTAGVDLPSNRAEFD